MSVYLQQNEQENLNDLVKLLHKTLYNKKEQGSEKALRYLIEDRGVTHDLIRDFQIGWYPPNRIISERKTCRGRIVFPVIDEFGNSRILTGRFPMRKEEIPSGMPHWIHEAFPKKFFLYGLNLAWPHILSSGAVVIVEGQLDVIACRKYGIKNVVGVIGSALTEESIAKLVRFAETFYLMFDSDEAGNKAYERTKEILDRYSINNIRIPLKYKGEHYDPDDLLSKFGPKVLLQSFSYFKEKHEKTQIEESMVKNICIQMKN